MAFDDRVIRVTIEFKEGDPIVYEDLAITATGVKFNNPNQNSCIITIDNIKKDARDRLATVTSPYNPEGRELPKIKLEVGRKSTGTSILFIGSIWMVNSSQPPDITSTLTCKAGIAASQKMLSISYKGKEGTDASVICEDAAKSLELNLDFQATSKKIASYSYAGPLDGQIKRIGMLGYQCFEDDGELVVVDPFSVREEKIFTVNPNNLVGVPQLTSQGVNATVMYDQSPALAGKAEIESIQVPFASGTFYIFQLDFSLANRDKPWYLTMKTSRLQ